MALSTLTLSVTSGVRDRQFKSKIVGKTAGSIITVESKSSLGFSESNGFILNQALPADPVISILERDPTTNEQLRTVISLTSYTAYQVAQQAEASVSGGRTIARRVVQGSATGDGSLVWNLFITDDLGSTVAAAVGGAPSPTVPEAPTLGVTSAATKNTLTFSDGSTGGSAITSRKLYRSTSPVFTPGLGNLLVADPTFPYDDSGLTNGVTYYYQGIATNLVGDSLASGTVAGTPVATPVAPVNSVLPAISGTATEGSTLTASTGTWSGSPTSYAYQWYRGGVAISGSVNSTRILTSADVGAVMTVTVTATNGVGSTPATSAGTASVAAASTPVPVNSVAPVVSGTPDVGQTLSVTNGTWSNSPTSYAYQWRRDGINISGATAATYLLTSADAVTSISCRVSATNAGGTGVATSAGSTINAAVPLAVVDWRAVASAVTLLDGTSQPLLLAQQASASTKTRSASFSVPSTGAEAGVIYTLPSHNEDYVASFYGHTGFMTGAVIEYTTDLTGATGWTNSGYTTQATSTPLLTFSAGRRQAVRIPAGAAKLIRFRLTAATQAMTVYPLIHKWPASGKAPIAALVGNSLFYYSYDDKAGEDAIQAQLPTWDWLIINWATPSMSGDNISKGISQNTQNLVNAYGAGFVQYVVSQGINGTSVTGSSSGTGGLAGPGRPYDSSEYSSMNTILNRLFTDVAAAGMVHIPMEDTYRGYDNPSANSGAYYNPDIPQITPTAQGNGVKAYNDALDGPKIKANFPHLWDDNYDRPSLDIYLKYLNIRADISDGVHPNTAGLTKVRQWRAETLWTYLFTGALPKHEVLRRVEAVEASNLQADYDDASYALLAVPSGAPAKAGAASRLAATVPMVKYNTALGLVGVAEGTRTQVDKDAAQSALDIAVGVQNGTTTSLNSALQTRITAITVVTETKRALVALGRSAALTGANPWATLTAAAALALLDPSAGATGWTLTNTTAWTSVSTANGSNSPITTDAGVISGTVQQGHMVRSATTGTYTITGLDPTKKYDVYVTANYKSGAAGRFETITIAGTVGAEFDPTGNPHLDQKKDITGVSSIAITLTKTANNTVGFAFISGILIVEHT